MCTLAMSSHCSVTALMPSHNRWYVHAACNADNHSTRLHASLVVSDVIKSQGKSMEKN
jgi:hypothetical protein